MLISVTILLKFLLFSSVFSVLSCHTFSGSPQAAAKFNSDDDYLQKEISEVYNAILGAQNNIGLGILPPLDAVKIPIDKFKAIMEIVGLDYEDVGDYPPHQHYMRVRIRTLQDTS